MREPEVKVEEQPSLGHDELLQVLRLEVQGCLEDVGLVQGLLAVDVRTFVKSRRAITRSARGNGLVAARSLEEKFQTHCTSVVVLDTGLR